MKLYTIYLYIPNMKTWSIYYIGSLENCEKVKGELIEKINTIGKPFDYQNASESLELFEFIDIKEFETEKEYQGVSKEFFDDLQQFFKGKLNF